MLATPPEQGNARPTTIGAALDKIFASLEASGLFFGHGTDNAWDEAVQLVLATGGYPLAADESVLLRPLSEEGWSSMARLLERRVGERMPLPYLLGSAWFAGLEFRCDERALVPRSPLAELIQLDYSPWWGGEPPARILDLCCGGGCIGIAAAVYSPQSQVVLADIDEDALELARENMLLYDLQERVEINQSDLFAGLPRGSFDLILCNPPYVDADDLARMPAEYLAEPARGLGAGSDGLAIAMQVLAQAGAFLSPRGLLFMEVGNSWLALEERLPRSPLSWVEFANGGHGVLAITAAELALVAKELSSTAPDGVQSV
ncbi:MAG: ribosomal protein L3 glutamine methyltransferase [Halieaceae bacterium]|jgi:ribosomal protein L3 glutamine methyltransferase